MGPAIKQILSVHDAPSIRYIKAQACLRHFEDSSRLELRGHPRCPAIGATWSLDPATVDRITDYPSQLALAPQPEKEPENYQPRIRQSCAVG